MASKVKTLADINSVSALASHNKQLAKMEVSIDHLEKAVDSSPGTYPSLVAPIVIIEAYSFVIEV